MIMIEFTDGHWQGTCQDWNPFVEYCPDKVVFRRNGIRFHVVLVCLAPMPIQWVKEQVMTYYETKIDRKAG